MVFGLENVTVFVRLFPMKFSDFAGLSPKQVRRNPKTNWRVESMARGFLAAADKDNDGKLDKEELRTFLTPFLLTE